MKLIKPSVEYIPQEKERIPFKHIELCARTCYKSENKITVDSAHKFVEGLIMAGHWAMLEHGTLYLYLEVNPDNAFKKFKYVSAKFTAPYNWNDVVGTVAAKYRTNPYSRVNTIYSGDGRKVYITTNYRVILDNDWVEDLQFTCESPTEYHKKRYTMKFICDRGVSHELVRHRVFSFAQESQRYCNYSKDKFSHEITFIDPSWNMLLSGVYNGIDKFDGDYFNHALRDAEKYYFKLLDLGWTPQQARCVLPNATKTEIILTGFEDDWNHFFDLRLRGTTGRPHPDIKRVASLAFNQFVDNGIIDLVPLENSK